MIRSQRLLILALSTLLSTSTALPAMAGFDLIILPSGKYTTKDTEPAREAVPVIDMEASGIPVKSRNTLNVDNSMASVVDKNNAPIQPTNKPLPSPMRLSEPQINENTQQYSEDGGTPIDLLSDQSYADEQNQTLSFNDPIEFAATRPLEDVKTWRARENEPVQEVLDRWSNRADIDLKWAAQELGTVTEPVSYFGSFTGAVEALLLSSDTTLYGTFRFETDGDEPAVIKDSNSLVAAVPVPAVAESFSEADMSPLPWTVTAGQSLRDVLEDWTNQSPGMQLVWNSEDDWEFSSSFALYGSLNEAVQELLTRMNNQTVRPVGTVYADPVEGQYIVIESEEGQSLT